MQDSFGGSPYASASQIGKEDAAEVAPVLMRVSFKEGTSDEWIRETVESIDFDATLKRPLTLRKPGDGDEPSGAIVGIVFPRDDPEEPGHDGGVWISLVPSKAALDLSRLPDDPMITEYPKVIREKQVMNKLVAQLDGFPEFVHARKRAFGSGSF